MNRKDDLATLQDAKPFLRSAIALAIFLRRGADHEYPDFEYQTADRFIARLEADLTKE